ncbi:MAG TPA: hypothetical protein VF429_01160, partial [Anaerolineae bacterium]
MSDKTILLLGGAGLVGVQIARQIAHDVRPDQIILASLYQREVREVIGPLEKEFSNVQFTGVWGDVFVRADFADEKRTALLQSAERRANLFDDLMGDLDETYARSRLVRVIRETKPDVIVDSINTATAISYQDVYTASVLAQQRMDALFARIETLNQSINPQTGNATEAALRSGVAELEQLRKSAKAAFDVLVLSQAVPQLIRHVILVLRAMEEVGT